jgi:uncharacterized protein YbaP (TraB family)
MPRHQLLTCLAAALIALGALGACGGRPVCASVVQPPGARGAPSLWKVSKPDAATIWLYGTIHNAGADDVPPAAWTALEGSKRFVSELGDLAPDQDRLRDLALIRSGKTLDYLLDPDDWWALREALRGTVREDELRRMRPWYAMARLTAHVAPPPSPTMDFALTDRARSRGIPIDHLETWDDQLAALGGNVDPTDLVQAIRSRDRLRCELAQLREVYAAGDQPVMQKLLVIAKARALLVTRNQRWFPKLQGLAVGEVFVAVGLGHVLGDEGLLALFERAGFAIERAPPP